MKATTVVATYCCLFIYKLKCIRVILDILKVFLLSVSKIRNFLICILGALVANYNDIRKYRNKRIELRLGEYRKKRNKLQRVH